MSKTIYYFTATGNSLQAALDIANGIGDAEVVSIAKTGMAAKCDSDVIGFVFPSYAWGMPNMVHDFISSGTFNPNAYFFTVVTCGSSMGGSAYDVDILLREKGAMISYAAQVKMVSNYIPMYDINTATQNKVLDDASITLAGIIDDLKAQKSCKFKKGLRLVRWIRGKMVAQYKTIDKDYNVNESCIGCGTCASVCPARNIEIVDGKPKFLHRCEHCIACIHWCPQRAINYENKTQKRKRYHHPKVEASQLP